MVSRATGEHLKHVPFVMSASLDYTNWLIWADRPTFGGEGRETSFLHKEWKPPGYRPGVEGWGAAPVLLLVCLEVRIKALKQCGRGLGEHNKSSCGKPASRL
ncbi:unnamed protein product [Merluccius merluccius]